MHKILKVLVVVVIAVAFKNVLHYILDEEVELEKPASQSSEANSAKKLRLFTKEELANSDQLLLAILGNVYDVSKGEKHYKPGGSYDFFVGKDASRSYVTGNFKDDLNDDLEGLTDEQIGEIFNWKKFYDDTYVHVGLVQGAFFDSNGQKTQALIDALEKEKKHIEVKNMNTQFNQRFPSCNSEWTQEKGVVRLWCTPESGGVKRSWSGVPRLVSNPVTNSEGCACVNEDDLDHPNVKLYPKCDPKSTSCSP